MTVIGLSNDLLRTPTVGGSNPLGLIFYSFDIFWIAEPYSLNIFAHFFVPVYGDNVGYPRFIESFIWFGRIKLSICFYSYKFE